MELADSCHQRLRPSRPSPAAGRSSSHPDQAASDQAAALAVLAACLGTSSTASAGEPSGTFNRVSCSAVRFYVAKYSAAAAEQWARSNGATDAEVEAGKRCLNPETTRTAKTQTSPLAVGSYGW